MDPGALLERLVELARETDLSVQRVGRAPAVDGVSPSASSVCRVRGELRVMLSDADPLSRRIQVLARALAEARAAQLEGRFLPPAVRECLERASGAGARSGSEGGGTPA
jgi:hypothetical protein